MIKRSTDTLTQHDLNELLSQKGWPQVTLTMPTHRAGREVRQDPIRLRNLLSRAKEQLCAGDMEAGEADRLLAPATALLENEDFWRHQAQGLAIAINRDEYWQWRLPLELSERAEVGERLAVRPLLPLFQTGGRFFVLALSMNDVRFFAGTAQGIEEEEIENLPKSLRAEIGMRDEEGTLQFHSHSAPSRGRGETDEAIYHAHHGGEEQKKDVLQFCHAIDRSLQSYFADESAPLVLACVDYLAPIYAETNEYKHLYEQHISGNPETWSAGEVHERASKLLEPYFHEEEQRALARYREQAHRNSASNSTQEIMLAAEEGRIDTLLVKRGATVWGHVDPELRAVQLLSQAQPGAEDLLERAVVSTLRSSGKVFSLPGEELGDESAAMAAVFRYPTSP